MMIRNDEGFYFDRIHILSWRNKWTLESQLPIKEMIAGCKAFNIIKFKESNVTRHNYVNDNINNCSSSGYKSKIEIIAPTANFLRLLSENEAALGKAYKINYVEIAYDVFCESAGDAELKADILFDNLRKKYSFSFIYQGKLIKTREELIKDKIRGLFASRTFYSSYERERGKKHDRFLYVVYARHSKINNQYCTHREWRITGSGLIYKKTRLKTVNDLFSFDIEEFFKKKETEYLVKEEINIPALGRWLKGYDGRRKLTTRQNINVQLAARHYVGFRIYTYSDLVTHFKKEKKIISNKRGVRSEWDNKILSLKSYEQFRIVQHE